MTTSSAITVTYSLSLSLSFESRDYCVISLALSLVFYALDDAIETSFGREEETKKLHWFSIPVEMFSSSSLVVVVFKQTLNFIFST